MDSFFLIPVRCTCGKILGRYQKRYEKMLADNWTIEDALNELGLKNICCRMPFIHPYKIALNTMNRMNEMISDASKLNLQEPPKVDNLPRFDEKKATAEIDLYPTIELEELEDVSHLKEKPEQILVSVGEGYKVPIQTPRIFSTGSRNSKVPRFNR